MSDRFSAIWVSHSSISDFLRCPKSYYYANVYRQPNTKKKIRLTGPALSLGTAVHEVLESLSVLPVVSRFNEPLLTKFDRAWEKVSGRRGGFTDEAMEYRYKNKGQEMIRRVMNNPGPVGRLAIKIQIDLPSYWLSEEENIMLCGKIDWLEYLKDSDAVHIIDFKTGKTEEDPDSLQLPIYHLLVHNCQKRKVEKASYWYLESSDVLTEKELPNLGESEKRVLDIARQIKIARQLERYKCPQGDDGCRYCKPYEMIIKGEAERVGTDDYGSEIYILPNKSDLADSVIL